MQPKPLYWSGANIVHGETEIEMSFYPTSNDDDEDDVVEQYRRAYGGDSFKTENKDNEEHSSSRPSETSSPQDNEDDPDPTHICTSCQLNQKYVGTGKKYEKSWCRNRDCETVTTWRLIEEDERGETLDDDFWS